MKKLLLAVTAMAAMTGTASAADLAARPYTKAPIAAPLAPSWTGFYIFGGGGGGLQRGMPDAWPARPQEPFRGTSRGWASVVYT